MGRKVKFSKEIKLRAIKDYQEGHKSTSQIATGEMAFDDKPRNQAYSKELKMSTISDYLNGIGSLYDISKKHGIYSEKTLRGRIIMVIKKSRITILKGDIY